ncbi:MAG: FtsX-like permease family protein [Eubacterium sp.]|nr:FtsX-like permease family protein [Eubacterium sp.]
MKYKNYIKMCTRGIKKNKSRFISMVCIAALGVGFLAGLLATTPSMKESCNNYIEKLATYDIYMQSTLGFSENDLDALKEKDYLDKVEGSYQKDVYLKDSKGEKMETRILYTDFTDENRLNRYELVEGRDPKNKNECILVNVNPYSYEVDLNSYYEDEDGNKYKVVGIGTSPLLLSAQGEVSSVGSGKLALAMFTSDQNVSENDRDVYTAVYATALVENRDSFSDEYESEIDGIKEKLEAFGKIQVKERRQEIVDEATKELDEGKAKLADGKADLAEGKAELADGKATLKKEKKDALAKLADAKATLEKNAKDLEDGIVKIDDGIKTINSKLSETKGQLKTIEDSLAQLTAITQLPPEMEAQKNQLIAGKAQCEAGIQQMESKKAELTAQRKALVSKRADIKEGWEQYYENEAKAYREFADAEADIKEAEAEIRDAEADIKEAEAEIKDAEAEIRDIEQGQWFVNSRLDTQGIGNYKSDVEIVGAIAKIFPVFFFLVASLVVLTTMTRMIEEERMLVGTLKSLGYSNGIIRNYYMLYGLVSCIIGSVFGLAIGFPLLPAVISNAYGMMYNVPIVKGIFIWDIAIGIVLLNIAVILFTIISAVRSELKEKPALLLQPKSPSAGKRILLERITPLWNRIKFTHKVTLRNLFRYKKRFFMTVIGVAGCVAMLVAGFGLKDSIKDIVDNQYGEINTYDIMLSVDENSWEGDSNIFANEGIFAEQQVNVKAPGMKDEDANVATLHMPKDNSQMDGLMLLRERLTHKEIPLTDEGVIISEKMSEVLGVSVGDVVMVQLDDRTTAEAKVTGINEIYLQNRVYMTPKLYEKLYDREAEFTVIYGKYAKKALEKQSEDDILIGLMERDNVNYAVTTSSIKVNFTDSIKNIDYIVWVLIAAAGLLTVIVVYNLTNINICERKKEIATLKVLGFYEKESSRYIFREIDVLAAIGILAGCLLGALLHNFILGYIEVGGMMFGRELYFTTFFYSALIVASLTFVVNNIMKRTIKKIDMVESMKANE